MSILNINGNPYTSAEEDLHLQELKKQFTKILHQELTAALRSATGGQARINLPKLLSVIDQAYYMGRDK